MKITVIGAGNMGGAIAAGLAAGRLVKPSDISVSDPGSEKLEALKAAAPAINTFTDNKEAVKAADLVIVAVKPWLLGQVLREIAPVMDYSTQAIASVVAGVDCATIRDTAANGSGTDPVIFRIIPNTAISIGRSVTFISQSGAGRELTEEVKNIFSELGMTFVIPEEMLTAATSLASCGVAFALKYLDASISGGIKLGFGEAEARDIVIHTMKGAVGLLEHNRTMPQTEIDKVTTPGGITLKGLQAMREAGFDNAVLEGLLKSR